MPLVQQSIFESRQRGTAQPAQLQQKSPRKRIYISIKFVLGTLKSPACTPELISELEESSMIIIAAGKLSDEYWPFVSSPLHIMLAFFTNLATT